VFNDTSDDDANVGSDLTVGGWTIDSAYDGTIDAGSANLDVNGQWRQEGGTFTAPSPTRGMTLSGDFTHSGGTFTHNSGIVTFDGSDAQTVETVGVNFWDLTVNAGSTLVDLSGLDVLGTLTNNGTLQRTRIVSSSADMTFFSTGGYGGLVLNANNSDLGSTTVMIKGNQDCTTTAGETVKRCFDIIPSSTTNRNATITFYFANSELSGNDCNTLNAYHWNGSSWVALTLDTNYDGDGRSCGADPQSVRVKNVSTFSPFTLKSSSGPNAVTLHALDARSGPGLADWWWLAAAALLGLGGLVLILRARGGADSR
jgi:hypothetical protein